MGTPVGTYDLIYDENGELEQAVADRMIRRIEHQIHGHDDATSNTSGVMRFEQVPRTWSLRATLSSHTRLALLT